MLSEQILNDIKLHCKEQAPKEACGFIVKNEAVGKLEILRAKNISEDPFNHVIIDPATHLHASLLGPILYIYHSQKSRDPSSIDFRTAKQVDCKLLMYSLDDDKFIYIDSNNTLNKYEGIEFKMGENDCYTLVIKYFKTEFNKDIPHLYQNRTIEWYKENYDFIGNALKEINHEFIVKQEMKVNDVIVMSYGKNRNHFGVLLPNSLILHHPMGHKSIIEPLHKFTDKILYAIRIK